MQFPASVSEVNMKILFDQKTKKKQKKKEKKLIHGKFEELISKLQCKTTDLEKSP